MTNDPHVKVLGQNLMIHKVKVLGQMLHKVEGPWTTSLQR